MPITGITLLLSLLERGSESVKVERLSMRFHSNRLSLLLVVKVAVISLLYASPAGAAQIQACWATASVTPDMASAQLLADETIVLMANVLPGSVTGTRSCAQTALPATLSRGVDHPITLRAMNAFGEVGPPSGPVTFRPPTIPANLTGISIQAVVGP